jgi:hypothetical protein
MKKPKCIICGEPATRSGEVGISLEHWQSMTLDTGVKVELCTEHAKCVIPIITLNNPRFEVAHG